MTGRRSFMKNVVALGLSSPLFAASADSGLPVGQAPQPSGSGRLNVLHEWGALEEVVVGYPYFRIGGPPPKAAQNYHHPNLAFAGLGMLWALLAPKMPFEKFVPVLWAKQNDQINAVIKILVSRGIVVHQVEKISASELAYEEDIGPACLQQFPRDPILVIGDRYIELPMNMPFRRKERFPIRRTLQGRLAGSNTPMVSAPEPFPLPEDDQGSFGPSAFLEGGDIFLIGNDVYVGNTGNASNSKGIAWLRSQLDRGYRVHEVKMSKDFLHLDCALCTPRPGLAIVCREAFPSGLPDFLQGWELIEVSKADAETKLACNGLVLDQKTIIIGADTPALAQQLDRAGLNVYVTPFDMVTALGGGFRCWHHPLVRKS